MSAAGLFASVLNVKYRDVGQIIPFVIQFGYFLAPVAYPTSYVESTQNSLIYKLYVLNPVVGLIDCMRWSLLDDYMLLQIRSPKMLITALANHI